MHPVQPAKAQTPVSQRAIRTEVTVGALIGLIILFFIATFPATWLLMLFFGNVGANVSYWGALPLGILVSSLLAGATSGYRSS
jgi:hypothetical protein